MDALKKHRLGNASWTRSKDDELRDDFIDFRVNRYVLFCLNAIPKRQNAFDKEGMEFEIERREVIRLVRVEDGATLRTEVFNGSENNRDILI